MLRKLTFNIVFASDEDPEFPANELNTHGPTVQGWRSKKKSPVKYPEVILKLHSPGKIFRIQVLAHQYIIPDRIELWLYYSPNDEAITPSNSDFEYLGFIALSDNSSSNFQSRELQNVSVAPKIGTHIKLRFGGSYTNKLNQDEQVALIAVNILGVELSVTELEEANNITSVGATSVIEAPIGSVCDDLSFSMYVDETIADIIRTMELKKHKAVEDERFEYARKLKLCISALRNAGERLGRYALAKRQAVYHEDFTSARLRKEQINIYRNAVFKKLLVEQLLESNDEVHSENDVCTELYAAKPNLPSPPSLQDVAATITDKSKVNCYTVTQLHSPKLLVKESKELPTKSPQTVAAFEDLTSPKRNRVGRSPCCGSPVINGGSFRRRNKSAPHNNSYEDYDERTIPTLRHSHTNEFLRDCHGITSDPEIVRGRSKLNDRERRQAALPILIFGEDMVELFYSRQFQDREEGLSKLREFLRGKESIEPATGVHKVARASTFLLHRTVRDAVFSVFNQALETVRMIFLEYIPKGVSLNEVARCVDRLLPELLAKSGDPSARIHNLAQHTILSVAACPEVKDQNLIVPALSRPVGSGTHPRLALSRMLMLEQLTLSQGIGCDKQSGLTCRSLSECGCSGLHHPAEPVRKVAERILLLVYKLNPRLVRKQLPPDDDVTRRNLLYRQLFTEFDKLDLKRKKELIEMNKSSECRMTSEGDTPQSSITNSPIGVRNRAHHKISNEAISKQQSTERLSKEFSLSNENNTKKDIKSNYDSISCIPTNHNEISCPFCDWSYFGNDSTQLDRHFWSVCPILTKCPQCEQVLEVSALNYHLISECDAKLSYVSCKRCTESIHKNLYELHMLEDFCSVTAPNSVRCPLCHKNIPNSNSGTWKNHLLADGECLGKNRLN